MRQLSEKIPTIINTITAAYPKTLAIYIFGSELSGKTTPTSDLDIAVLCSEEVDAYKLWETAQSLAIIFSQDIDLIDLQRVNTNFGFQIIHTGTRIYCRDKDAVDIFEEKIFAKHLRLKERLASLYKMIQKRGGIIYGSSGAK